MHLFLATSWIDPIVNAVVAIVNAIDSVVHNRGWSLVIFALGLKMLFWPLNAKQFTSMIKMQQLAPQLKKLQEKYGKSDPQKYQQETMELYKRNGANPLAGCWPMLLQMPVLFSVYWAVIEQKKLYADQHWLWIGSPFTQHLPVLPVWKAPLLASSLALPDLALLVLYAISMYLIARYGSMPSTDPQQAKTQRLMAWISPLMLGYMGFRYQWPSAMVVYWFSYNAFTMGQQFYLLAKHHQPLSAIDNEHAITDQAPVVPPKSVSANGAKALPAARPGNKSSKSKKGAKR